jgi:hypothetical protein
MGGAVRTEQLNDCEPVDARRVNVVRGKVNMKIRRARIGTSWFDWRMAFAWLIAVAVASAIFFFPITRLVDSLGD